MDYKEFVTFTVLASIISLERVDLKKKVVNGAEILEVLHQLPTIKKFLLSFYNCHYDEFFVALGKNFKWNDVVLMSLVSKRTSSIF